MQTLFLDFDGVLHPEFCHASKHFSCLAHFEAVLRRFPEIDVVIASTWRLHTPIDELRSCFSADVADRVIDVTPNFCQLADVSASMVSFHREAECIAWLRANDRVAKPWLAIDDRSWLYRPFNPAVFLVNGRTGLTADSAVALSIRLARL
ncbi:HAD domain-containing protein [Acidovorax sp. NPDC077693]|uniref:HAD domain-containing protein n=1 Tax=unclassified Acidovorax TaxID=2684926 RepID=UPI0037CC425F